MVMGVQPCALPFNRNCTPTTPTLSEALAVTLVVLETVEPEAGEVMLTVGGVVSGGAGVVALAGLDCAERLPAASKAAEGKGTRLDSSQPVTAYAVLFLEENWVP